MSDKITLNNTVFVIPDVGDQNYGEEVNSYLLELANTINGISGAFDIPTSEVTLNPTSTPANIEGLLFPSNDVVSGNIDFTLIRTAERDSDGEIFRFVEKGTMSFFQGSIPDNTNKDGFQFAVETISNIDRQIVSPNNLAVTINVTVNQEGGGGNDEQQQIDLSDTPDNGTYTLSFDGQDVVISFSDTLGDIDTKINSLSTIDSATIAGTSTSYTVTFGGTQADTNVNTITTSNNSLIKYQYIKEGEAGLDFSFSGNQLQYTLETLDTNIYTETEVKFIFKASTTVEE